MGGAWDTAGRGQVGGARQIEQGEKVAWKRHRGVARDTDKRDGLPSSIIYM